MKQEHLGPGSIGAPTATPPDPTDSDVEVRYAPADDEDGAGDSDA